MGVLNNFVVIGSKTLRIVCMYFNWDNPLILFYHSQNGQFRLILFAISRNVCYTKIKLLVSIFWQLGIKYDEIFT